MTATVPTLLQPDPVVTQRDDLLDVDGAARRFSRRLGVDGALAVDSCRRECVCYSVGRRIRVVHRIEVEGHSYRVATSSFRSKKRSERAYLKAVQRTLPAGKLRPVVLDEELTSVTWAWPNDRTLAGLAQLDGPSDELSALLDRKWTKSRIVDYYPEASAVVRCLDDSDHVLAYGKVHAGDGAERTHEIHQALEGAARESPLRVPRVLAYSRRHRAVLVEPIAGRSIGQLEGPALIDGLEAYGAALGHLHSLPVPRMPSPSRPPLERLSRRARGIGVVRPEVEEVSREVIDTLRRRWPDATAASVVTHGDANANNAILQNGHVALIDFDRAAWGSAASDIGNFLSLQAYLRILGALSGDDERARASAFLRGYSSVRSLPARQELNLHLAASLAERAFGSVYRVHSQALLHIQELLAEARALISANGSRL
jgi:aminoglycoside phosphotransferase (APT) family kinase protein